MTGSDDAATIAHQSLAQLGGRSSILVKQRADHPRLDRLIDRARATRAAGGREHAVALRAAARLVFSHAFAEESVLFRAARRVLLKGDPLTLHIESAQQVNELVTCLDASSGDASGHAALLERTFVVLHEEVRSEEDELLPRLQQLLSPRQLRALGRRWELVRRIAPTRPHPLVSRSPPGQALSALPLTVLDRGRDQLQWLDEATPGRWSGWLATATAPSLRLRARWGGSRCCSGGSAQRPGRRPAIRAYVTTRTLRNPRSSTGSGRTIPAEMLIGGTRG